MTARSSKKNSPPESVISSAGAFSALPTRRLPARSASGSAAPEAEMPKCAQPKRPRSWTVVRNPGATMWRAVMGVGRAQDSPRAASRLAGEDRPRACPTSAFALACRPGGLRYEFYAVAHAQERRGGAFGIEEAQRGAADQT